MVALPFSRGQKAMADILQDEAFWAEQRALLMKVMVPLWTEAFVAGAELGALEKPVKGKAAADLPYSLVDIQVINNAAAEFISGYSNTWWMTWSMSQRQVLGRAIQSAYDHGLGPKDVAKAIASAFAPKNAEAIAITEMTNAIGAGAQAQYRAQGFGQWDWRTVADARVDPVCEANGQNGPYPMTTPFAAAHPRCRCWPVPAGEAS